MVNVIADFLDAIDVRYTRGYTDKLYAEHPNRDNLFGIGQMLRTYGIKTIGVHIQNKDLSKLTFPCICHVDGDFVVVLDSCGSNITIVMHGKQTNISCDKFSRIWSGNALVVENVDDTDKIIEPNLDKHLHIERVSVIKRVAGLMALLFVCITGIVNHIAWISLPWVLYLTLNVMGLCTCIMLMQKQVFGMSKYGDKVCSMFRHTNCNNILNGDYSEIAGISWSEIGTGYFIANILLLSIYPHAIGMLYIINWAAMCYGVWSIYYQWHVARNWCVLCTVVQAIVWCAGILAAVFANADVLASALENVMLSAGTFVICIMIVHQYAVASKTTQECSHLIQKYRAIKTNDKVAKVLIENSACYKVSETDSHILLGNKNANIRVTILSNPYCIHCAKEHRIVDELLEQNWQDLCIQYVFVAFSTMQEDGCRYLISCYDEKDMKSTLRLYSLWYDSDTDTKDRIIQNYNQKHHSKLIEQEKQKHLKWFWNSELTQTPTVLVNGYILPREYEIRDLIMLSNCKIIQKNIMQDINGRSTTPLGAE